MCSDVDEVFKQLTGLGRARRLKHVWQSPFTLHKRVVEAIRNEARIASEGRPARIVAKMNALLEPDIIDELYAASQAGVKIDLIVRGICALKPGVPGLSENIRVRSIVGRFLEHSRVFWFRNDGADDVWLSSADWMDRNFFRRIELGFPVLDPGLKRRVIREGLKPYLDDNCQSWIMDSDGGYRRQTAKRGKRYSAQEELLSSVERHRLIQRGRSPLKVSVPFSSGISRRLRGAGRRHRPRCHPRRAPRHAGRIPRHAPT